MTYVIAEPCIGTKDTACVDACPVDCIHPKKDSPAHAEEEMLYIDPGGVHRLRSVRAGVPGVGHLRAGRSAGKVGVVHRAQREVFRTVRHEPDLDSWAASHFWLEHRSLLECFYELNVLEAEI